MWMWKRWWAFTLILTLALTLTSCANKRNLSSLQLAGYAECTGYVQFELGVEATSQSNRFTLLVNPLEVPSDAPAMQFAVAYAKPDDSLGGRPVGNGSGYTLEVGATLDDITLSINDFLNPYDGTLAYFVITPGYDGNGNLINWISALTSFQDYSSVCQLPYPDGSTGFVGGSDYGNFR